MKRIALIFQITALALSSTLAGAASPDIAIYSASSRQKGLPFDMTVTETRRTPTKSYLRIPGFNSRTSVQARWVMCVFADVAVKRGFKYWTVVYPPEKPGDDQLVVAFSNSAAADPKILLGQDFAADRTLGDEMTDNAPFLAFCKSAGFR